MNPYLEEHNPTYAVVKLEKALKAYSDFQLDPDGKILATMLEEDLNGQMNSIFPSESSPDEIRIIDSFAEDVEENKKKFHPAYCIWSHMNCEIASARRVLEDCKEHGELNGQELKLINKALDRVHIVKSTIYPKGTTYIRGYW